MSSTVSTLVEIKKVTELPDLALTLQNYFAHCGLDGVLYKINIQGLVDYITPYVADLGSSPFIGISGTVLPNPTTLDSGIGFVGPGTYTQTTGGNIVTTNTFNILGWDGTTWSYLSSIAVPTGPSGWSPVYAAVADGNRIVQQLVDYVGGTGTKPTAGIGQYVGSSGLVTPIASAVDYRGSQGSQGTAGTANMITWTATTFTSGSQVIKDGEVWQANANTLATEVPGVSVKWFRPLFYNRNSKAVFNVTTEVPLSGGAYYTFDTACRAVPTEIRKFGLIITYEKSARSWDTIAFRDSDIVTNWTVLDYWLSIDTLILYGSERTAIPKQYRRKGLIASFVKNGIIKIEQYIGNEFETSSNFIADANWIRISSYDDLTLISNKVNVNVAAVASLSNSLYNDSSYINWENIRFTAATGAFEAIDLTKLSTPEKLPVMNIESMSVNTGYGFLVTQFAADGSVLEFTSFLTAAKTSFNALTRFVKISLRITAGGNLLISDLPNVGFKLVTRLKSPYQNDYLKDRSQGVATLKSATVVSDWKNEKLAHCSTVLEDNLSEGGYLWASYYCSETSYTENALNGDIYCALLRINPCDFSQRDRFVALKFNDVVGSWTAKGISPYDPTLIIKSTVVQYIMVGNNQNDAFGTRYCSRNFNKTTLQFDNSIQNLFLRYTFGGTQYTEVMSVTNISVMVDRLSSRTGTDAGTYPIFSGRIDFSGGFYWVYMASLQTNGNGFQGAIMKSSDGITWDFVSMPPLTYLSVWEGALKVIGQKIYVFIKGNNRYNLYLYDITTDTWTVSTELNNQVYSRPFLFYYNSKLYAVYNSPNNVTTWGTVIRSGVGISVIDQATLAILDTQNIKTDAASHYMSVCEFKGSLFYMFTEDRRKHDITQMKGNISIINMDFLKI